MTAGPQRQSDREANLAIGKIIEVDGARLIAELLPDLGELSRVYAGDVYAVGQFGSIIRIRFGRRVIYAVVARLRMKSEYEAEIGIAPTAGADERIIEADLFGEGEWTRTSEGTDSLRFQRGVSNYPLPQQTVYLTPKAELRHIYGHGNGPTICLGEHVGAGGAPCHANLNELLGKHTAVLGSTGTGKSAAVAAMIHSILERGDDMDRDQWYPLIVVLDPHGEYLSAFPKASRLSPDDGTLSLPYWLLNLHETQTLLIGKTEYVATTQSNIVKSALLAARKTAATQLGLEADAITVDSPIPYRLSQLRQQIEDDKPSQASQQASHNGILQKLEVLEADGRLEFLMREWDGTDDEIGQVLGSLMLSDRQPRTVDLSGVPNEVAGIASAVIARSLFNYKLWQSPEERARDPILLVCEEAHRYVPNSGEAQYDAAQEAIRRIAKEGRKYGLGLVLVSQRPSEVEATVLSQCNSWLVLRISNEKDREHVRAMLPDTMAGLAKVLSGLRRQEAIFLGEATAVPSRIMVRALSDKQLPDSKDIDFDRAWTTEPTEASHIVEVTKRWRYQTR